MLPLGILPDHHNQHGTTPSPHRLPGARRPVRPRLHRRRLRQPILPLQRLGWADLFSTANATTQVPFPGYDITAPYPGNRSSGWRFSVQVKEGIPSTPSGMVATGSWISWGAPRDLMVKNTTNDTYGLAPLHPSWNVVHCFIQGRDLRSDDDGDIDPTCKGFLSDECIDDFHVQLADTYNRGGNKTGANRFPSAHPPPSCRERLRLYEAYTIRLSLSLSLARSLARGERLI